MSPTLDDLIATGGLQPWYPDIGPRQRERRLFVTREFAAWAQTLSDVREGRHLLSPRAEVEATAAEFVAGEKLIAFIRRINPPKGEGVIRINTTRYRLAGWCPEPQVFVAALGADARAMHGAGRPLNALGREVVSIRNALGVQQSLLGEIYELFQSQR